MGCRSGGCTGIGARDPALREADGHLASRAAFPLGLGLALLLATGARVWGARRAAPWLFVVALLHAACLQLLDAGSRLHFEHLALAGGEAAGNVWGAGLWIAILAICAIAVAGGLRAYAPALRQGTRFLLGARPAPAVVALALVLLGTAVYPSPDPNYFARELALAIPLRLLQLAAAAVLLAALHADLRERAPGAGGLDALLGERDVPGRWLDPVALACALWTAALAVLLVTTAYQRHPHVTDEVAYLFHARSLAAGGISIPAPRVPEAFEIYLIACEAGRCIAPVPTGWPAVLSLGVRAGAPWLVNPLLGALALLLGFSVVRQLGDRRSARLTALLLALSPWALFVSMSFMTHVVSLVFALGAGLAVVRIHRGGSLLQVVPAGLLLGAQSFVRPLEALCTSLVLGLATLATARTSGAARALAAAVGLALCAAAAGLPNLAYNRAVTGDPRVFPIMEYADAALGPGRNALGFGPDKGVEWGGLDPFPGHGLRDVVVNAQVNLTGIDRELLGWSVGSLGMLALLLVSGRIRPRSADGWLLFAAAVPPAAHSFYWYHGGPDFAARYWYLSIFPLVALVARGLVGLADEAQGSGGRTAARLAWAGPLLLSLLALCSYVPWRAIDKYTHFRGMRADVRALTQRSDLADALVLVRGEEYPDAASALSYNGVDPDAPAPLFVWARDAELEQRLRAAYPERRAWVLEGPSLTGGRYRLAPAP